jgi:hypothetical protein
VQGDLIRISAFVHAEFYNKEALEHLQVDEADGAMEEHDNVENPEAEGAMEERDNVENPEADGAMEERDNAEELYDWDALAENAR